MSKLVNLVIYCIRFNVRCLFVLNQKRGARVFYQLWELRNPRYLVMLWLLLQIKYFHFSTCNITKCSSQCITSHSRAALVHFFPQIINEVHMVLSCNRIQLRGYNNLFFWEKKGCVVNFYSFVPVFFVLVHYRASPWQEFLSCPKIKGSFISHSAFSISTEYMK